MSKLKTNIFCTFLSFQTFSPSTYRISTLPHSSTTTGLRVTKNFPVPSVQKSSTSTRVSTDTRDMNVVNVHVSPAAIATTSRNRQLASTCTSRGCTRDVNRTASISSGTKSSNVGPVGVLSLSAKASPWPNNLIINVAII